VADAWEFKVITIPGDTSGVWIANNSASFSIVFAIGVGATYSGSPNAWGAGSNILGANGATNGVAATSDTYQITGLIVLPGLEVPSASRSPFIMRPYDVELQLCRRYYEQVGMTVITTSPPYGNTSWYRASKRASPTLTTSGTLNGAIVAVMGYSPLEGVRQTSVASAASDITIIADARL
jgi:hypothetical protein